MRISTSQMHSAGLKAIQDQQAKLGQTQQQLATGKRFLTPSEDPAASAKLLGLGQSLNTTGQYQKNIEAARARQNLEEQSLDGISNALDRVREIAIQGNTTSVTNEDRDLLAAEVRQILDELLAYANTQDANGEYLFSGFQGHTQAFTADSSGNFTYNGDQGQRFVQVGPSRQIAVGDPGSDVFSAIRNGNGVFTTLDNPANNGSGVIDPGTVVDPAAIDGDTYTLTFPIATTAANALVFNDDLTTPDNLAYTLKINGTAVYTVDESGTPVATLDGLAAEINNDTTTTGVRAYVDSGVLYLANTSPTATAITVTEELSGGSDGDADTATGYFGSALTGATTPSANIVLSQGDATFYVVEDSAGNLETSGAYVSGAQITFNGIQTNVKETPQTSDSFTISPSINQDLFTTVQNLAITLETGGSGPSGLAQQSNAINRVLSDLDQSKENILGIRSLVGSRLSAIDSQQSLNEDFTLQIETSLSQVQDLDYAEAISRMNLQLVGLEAAQQSFVRIQGLSLFNFL